MKNAIPLKDWFGFIDNEYLSTYVKAGGSSVKFAVTPDELKPDLYATSVHHRQYYGIDIISCRVNDQEE